MRARDLAAREYRRGHEVSFFIHNVALGRIAIRWEPRSRGSIEARAPPRQLMARTVAFQVSGQNQPIIVLPSITRSMSSMLHIRCATFAAMAGVCLMPPFALVSVW